jgi:hypothetical protein
MSGRLLYAMWIKDPTGDPRKDVFAEVECTGVRLRYPGSSEEPRDYDITPTRLSLNDADLDPKQYPKIVQHILEHGH